MFRSGYRSGMRTDRTVPTARRVARALLGLTAVASLAVACGGDDEKGDDAPATTQVNGGDDGKPEDTAPGTPPSAWTKTAVEHRGDVGEKFTIECTPGGQPVTIWGSGLYTDDSSICTAAVQMGLIDFGEGGEVEIEIQAGEESYEEGLANGVTSLHYGPHEGSFTFPAAAPNSVEFQVPPQSWNRNATEHQAEEGEQFTLACSPDGSIGSVWGTGTYTTDSSICSAAVHAGVLDRAAGGVVTYEIAAGQDSYEGTEANGVSSLEFGDYESSFTFPDAG